MKSGILYVTLYEGHIRAGEDWSAVRWLCAAMLQDRFECWMPQACLSKVLAAQGAPVGMQVITIEGSSTSKDSLLDLGRPLLWHCWRGARSAVRCIAYVP
jgi:hypothetical protein